uniref:MADS transcription factor AP3-3 n=1 Tax=Glaucidium palmatum TaxID=39106 RepID=A0A7L7T4D1_9MAGN|nr:MADS transcription factor AP3-3 [Glaucidium palmatum]
MGRGKIEIKKIENATNRQVTYSKRRTGLMKKARELSILCDSEISLIMFSRTGRLSEFITSSTTQKKVYDQYQEVKGVDLWNSHYEKLQESLKKQKDINMRLRREIRQRIGEGIDDLGFEQLRGLEQDLENTVKVVRDRKYHTIATQTLTYRKKLKNAQETHINLVGQCEARGIYYQGDYASLSGIYSGGAQHFRTRLQPSQPNLQQGESSGFFNLRHS